MLKPLTKQKQALIVNSVKRCFETNSIDYLTKTAYNYLYLCSGFIAHYNWHGFMGHYENVMDLAMNIIRNKDMNMWSNFRPGDEHYEYYMSKKAVYEKLFNEAKFYMATL
jgi:hypothetical protein